MFIELASIPQNQDERIAGFILGAEATLKHMPNPSGNDPIKIELEYRDTGNCHIWLVTGTWKEVGGYLVEVYPPNPWDK